MTTHAPHRPCAPRGSPSIDTRLMPRGRRGRPRRDRRPDGSIRSTTLRALVPAFALLGLASVATAQAQETPAAASRPIAVVDSRRVLEAAPGFADAGRRLQAELDLMRRAAQAYDDSVRALAATLDGQARGATGTRQAELRARLDSLGEAHGRRLATVDSQAAARQEEVLAPFHGLAREAIEAERASLRVGLLFDLADDASPLLSHAPALDITDRVLARLRTMRVSPAPAGPRLPRPAGVAAPR